MNSAADAKNLVESCIRDASAGDQMSLIRFWEYFGHRLQDYLENSAALWGPAGGNLARTTEGHLAVAGCVLTAWAFWVLESKGIHHRGIPDAGWRSVLHDWMIPTLEALMLQARNLAIEEKAQQKVRGEIAPEISVPLPYTGWRTRIS